MKICKSNFQKYYNTDVFFKFTFFNIMLFRNKYTDANKTNTKKEWTRDIGNKDKIICWV